MILELMLVASLAHGENKATVDSSVSTKSSSSEPKCLDIKIEKPNAITKEMIPDEIGEVELIARLAFAETLAAGCPDDSGKIFPGIVHTIFNRINAFKEKGDKDPYRRTVFGKLQFASSLHAYGKSQWQEFVCPAKKNRDLYRKVYDLVQRVNNGEVRGEYSAATHYYLHMHSGKFRDQPWENKAELAKMLGAKCLGLYKVDKAFLKAPY